MQVGDTFNLTAWVAFDDGYVIEVTDYAAWDLDATTPGALSWDGTTPTFTAGAPGTAGVTVSYDVGGNTEECTQIITVNDATP